MRLMHDPAGHLFDEEFLLLHHNDLVGWKNVQLFESCQLRPVDKGQTIHVSQLHCVCLSQAVSCLTAHDTVYQPAATTGTI